MIVRYQISYNKWLYQYSIIEVDVCVFSLSTRSGVVIWINLELCKVFPISVGIHSSIKWRANSFKMWVFVIHLAIVASQHCGVLGSRICKVLVPQGHDSVMTWRICCTNTWREQPELVFVSNLWKAHTEQWMLGIWWRILTKQIIIICKPFLITLDKIIT